jgi:hypothetical protein
MDFACPRFVAIWGICHLNVPDLPDVLAQCRDKIPFHALHMVDIVLVSEVGTVEVGEQLQRLSCIREQVAWIFEAIDRFDDHAKACLSRAIGGPGEVLAYEAELGLAALIRKHVPDQGVELRTSDPRSKVKGTRHMGAKPLLSTGIIEKASLSSSHIARVKIHQCHLEPHRLHVLDDSSAALFPRPPELYSTKAKSGGAFKAI